MKRKQYIALLLAATLAFTPSFTATTPVFAEIVSEVDEETEAALRELDEVISFTAASDEKVLAMGKTTGAIIAVAPAYSVDTTTGAGLRAKTYVETEENTPVIDSVTADSDLVTITGAAVTLAHDVEKDTEVKLTTVVHTGRIKKSAETTIKVSPKENAINKAELKAADTVIRNEDNYQISDAGTQLLQINTVRTADVQVTSSNERIVKAGAVKWTAGQKWSENGMDATVVLSPVGVGTADVTVTMGTESKVLHIEVLHDKVQVSKSNVTLDRNLGTAAELKFTNSYKLQDPDVQVRGDLFEIEAVSGEALTYLLKVKEGSESRVPAGMYKVDFYNGAGNDVIASVNAKVTSAEPVVNAKQNAAVNVNLKNAAGVLTFTANNGTGACEVTNVALKSGESTYYSLAYAGNTVTATKRAGTAQNETLTFLVTVDGYKVPVEKTVTIKAEKTVPTLKLDTDKATLYPSEDKKSAVFTVENSLLTAGAKAELVADKNGGDASKFDLAVDAAAGTITVTAKEGAKTFKGKLVVTDEAVYESGITLKASVAITVKDTYTLALSKDTVQLNKRFDADTAATVMNIDGIKTAYTIDAANMEGANTASKKAKEYLTFAAAGKDITVTWNTYKDLKELQNGTYSFKIPVIDTNAKAAEEARVAAITTAAVQADAKAYTTYVTLKVKVVSTADKDLVSFKQSGSIDLLQRADSKVVLTPSVTGINNGVVTDVTLKNAAFSKFTAAVVDGKIELTLAPYYQDGKYSFKTGKQNVTIERVVVNGQTLKVNKKIAVTLTQSKPTIYIGSMNLTKAESVKGNEIETVMYAAKEGTAYDIRKVSIHKDSKKLFKAAYANGKLVLTQKKALKKGTYTVKLNVQLNGQASNAKTRVITCKVIVK